MSIPCLKFLTGSQTCLDKVYTHLAHTSSPDPALRPLLPLLPRHPHTLCSNQSAASFYVRAFAYAVPATRDDLFLPLSLSLSLNPTNHAYLSPSCQAWQTRSFFWALSLIQRVPSVQTPTMALTILQLWWFSGLIPSPVGTWTLTTMSGTEVKVLVAFVELVMGHMVTPAWGCLDWKKRGRLEASKISTQGTAELDFFWG
jgi:hypothetical protein